MTKNERSSSNRAKSGQESWHGFNVAQFDASATALLEHVEGLQRHLSTIKSVLQETRKRGTAAALTESDSVAKLAAACDRLKQGTTRCVRQAESVEKFISQWRTAERGSRKVRFETIAKQHEWRIVGNWPEPVVSGIVFVVVDDAKDKATVNGQAVQGLPTAEKLIAQITIDLQQLEKNKTEPEKFVSELWKAYQSCGGKLDDGVLVFDLLRELFWLRQSKKFRCNPIASQIHEYAMSQFRADLTAYLAAGSPAVRDGSNRYSLEIVGGSYAEHGLFMYFPQPDRLATCGRLMFRSHQT